MAVIPMLMLIFLSTGNVRKSASTEIFPFSELQIRIGRARLSGWL